MGAFGALDALKEGATKRQARQTYFALGGREFNAERRAEDVDSENYQLLNPGYRKGLTEAEKQKLKSRKQGIPKTSAATPLVPIPAAEPVCRLRVKDETPWRQHTAGGTISCSNRSMRGYTTKQRFTPSDIKGTEFDKVSLPPTRDGPVGSLSARDLIDPAAIPSSVPNTKQAEEHARDGNSKPDTEADSDSFGEKNHVTCTEDACLEWFRDLARGGIISRKRFDEFAAYAENPVAGMVSKNVFSCEDEEELADVMDAERRALQSRLIYIVKTERINFISADVRMAVEFLTKAKARRAREYIRQNLDTSAARAATSSSLGAANERESTSTKTKAEIEPNDWDAICGSGHELPPVSEKLTRGDMFADRPPPGDENEIRSSPGDAIKPPTGAVEKTAVKIEEPPTPTVKQEAEVGDPGDAARTALALGPVEKTAVKIEDAPIPNVKQESEAGDRGDAAGTALGPVAAGFKVEEAPRHRAAKRESEAAGSIPTRNQFARPLRVRFRRRANWREILPLFERRVLKALSCRGHPVIWIEIILEHDPCGLSGKYFVVISTVVKFATAEGLFVASVWRKEGKQGEKTYYLAAKLDEEKGEVYWAIIDDQNNEFARWNVKTLEPLDLMSHSYTIVVQPLPSTLQLDSTASGVKLEEQGKTHTEERTSAIFDVSGSVADWATRMLPSKSWFVGFFFEQFLPKTCSPTQASPDLECPTVENGADQCLNITAASTARTAQPSDDGDTCPVDLIVAVLTDNNRACREYFKDLAQEPLPLQRKPEIGKCCLLSCFFNTYDEYRKVHDIALAGSATPTLEPVCETDQLEPGSCKDLGRKARTFRGCGHYLDTRALRRLLQTVRIDFHLLLREQQRTGGIRWDTLDALQKYIAETMLDVNRVKDVAARDKMERRRAFARLVEMVSERPNAESTDSGFCPPVGHVHELEKPMPRASTTSADAASRVEEYTSVSSTRYSTYASKASTYDVDAYPTPGGEEWASPLLRQVELDKKRKQKKPIVPIDLEQLRKQACKVLAGGARNPDSDDDSSSTSSRSSSSEDDEEEACYKNGVADVFGEKSMVKAPLLKDRGCHLRYTPAGNTPNMFWRDGKKEVEYFRKRNKSKTTMRDPEKYTGWHIKYQQNKKQVRKFIGLKKYLPRNPDKKPEKAEMERREAMMKSMGDAKIARGLLMGFASERARFKAANKIVGMCYNKFAQKNGTITRRYLGRISTGKKKPSAKNKRGFTPIEQSCTGTIRLLGQRRAFQKCKTWRKKKERARDAKKVIKKHRIREKTWSRRCDGDLCRMLDLRYAARAILLRENFAKGTGSNKGTA